MTADDWVKIILAIGAASAAVLAAVAKVYSQVARNGREIDRLHRRVTLKS